MAVVPVVTSIKPRNGRAEGGDVVVIKGTGFTGATEVFFGSHSTIPLPVNDDTEITTFSPAGTNTVDVTVRAPGGISATTSASKFTYHEPQPSSSYRAALVATAPIIPGVATAIMVAFYSLYGTGLIDGAWFSLSIGILSGLAGWLSISGLYYILGFTTACGANVRTYSDLCEFMRELDVKLNGFCLEQEIEPRKRVPAEACINREKCASREACSWRDAAKIELSSGGLQWVLGTGYVNVYCLLHRAEEALIESASDNSAIVEAALTDELRLKGSDIKNRDDLLAKLRRAVMVLKPEAAQFLNKQPPIEALEYEKQARSDAGAASTTTGCTPADSHEAIADAKAVLRIVRSAIDGHRDDQRDGLVRARNHLMWMVAIFGLVTFTVVGLAIMWDVSKDALLAATAFYLVGATVGLFSRLHSQAAAHADVDDFGLFVAGLLASPLLSGSAAVIGVFVTAELITVGLMPTLLGAPAGAPGSTPDLTIVLSSTFDIWRNPSGLIYAAVFGLAPSLLIGTLQQQTTKFKEQLKSSAPSDQASKH